MPNITFPTGLLTLSVVLLSGFFLLQRFLMRRNSPRAAGAALNRLIVAGWNEIATFEAAQRIVRSAGRREGLRRRALRRGVFRRDLSAAVVALGGVSATSGSVGARLMGWMRSASRLAAGQHEGDAYAACARAAQCTASAYARALRMNLPEDVRFGVAREYLEIQLDRDELQRMRWGVRPTTAVNGAAVEVDATSSGAAIAAAAAETQILRERAAALV